MSSQQDFSKNDLKKNYLQILVRIEKDKDRRGGKGLGDWIDSIPCRVTVAILHQDDLKKGMNNEFTLFFKSSYSAIHPIPHNVVVQLILFFKSSWCKIANVERKINSAPQASAKTFAFSGLFILLYKYVYCTVYLFRRRTWEKISFLVN